MCKLDNLFYISFIIDRFLLTPVFIHNHYCRISKSLKTLLMWLFLKMTQQLHNYRRFMKFWRSLNRRNRKFRKFASFHFVTFKSKIIEKWEYGSTLLNLQCKDGIQWTGGMHPTKKDGKEVSNCDGDFNMGHNTKHNELVYYSNNI